jgi:hypothetical protein
MLSTGAVESSGGTASASSLSLPSAGGFSSRIANKIKCTLEDVVFGTSLGEGKLFHSGKSS